MSTPQTIKDISSGIDDLEINHLKGILWKMLAIQLVNTMQPMPVKYLAIKVENIFREAAKGEYIESHVQDAIAEFHQEVKEIS